MRKIKILVVEPDYILGNSYKFFFDKNGYKTKVCSDGQEAIDYIDVEVPDIILLEIQLASHNGYEFLYELRSYKEWFSIPVIIISLISEPRTKLDKNKLNSLGVTDFLYKPTTSLEKIKNHIDNRILVS